MSNTKTLRLGPEAQQVLLQIKELYSTRYSSFVWPCALVLSEFIIAHCDLFKGKTVLELGCGTGLCGIVASKVGSSVILTDKFDCQQSAELCRENIALNKVDAKLFPLEWGHIPAAPLPGHIDYIIGSDCFYDEADFEDILFTVSLLLLHNSSDKKETAFFFAHQLRTSAHSIECLAKKWNLQCRTVSFQPEKAASDRQVIEIFEIKNI